MSYIIIEKLHPSGGVKITTEDVKEVYLGYSLKDAERKFRDEHGLKGKKLQRIMT